MTIAPVVLFAARLILFEQGDRWGFKTAQGAVIIEPRYEAAYPFSRGIAAVCCDGGWAYIDRTGKVVIRPYVFDNGPDYFRGGLARYVENGKFGFFDRRGRVAITAQFDFAAPFERGRSMVCEGCREVRHGEHSSWEGGKWRYIDRRGKFLKVLPQVGEPVQPE